jgi:hypothetical protein
VKLAGIDNEIVALTAKRESVTSRPIRLKEIATFVYAYAVWRLSTKGIILLIHQQYSGSYAPFAKRWKTADDFRVREAIRPRVFHQQSCTALLVLPALLSLPAVTSVHVSGSHPSIPFAGQYVFM